MYECPGMNVRLALADIPYEIELRFWLACRLMLPARIRVDLHKWDGQPCDILVTDLDSTYGRMAYELATRRDQVRTLCFSGQDHADSHHGTRLDPDVTASALAGILRDMLPLHPSGKADVSKGLLGICLIEEGCGYEHFARNGGITLVVRHSARRIHARSTEDLLAAQSTLLEHSWSRIPLSAPYDHQYDGLISRSLDDFLITGCYRHQDKLPLLNDTLYRLKVWPDLGINPNDSASKRLASALYRKPWRVESVAAHCGVSKETANAFCWATLASGALAPAEEDGCTRIVMASESENIPQMMRRIARRFGLKAS